MSLLLCNDVRSVLVGSRAWESFSGLSLLTSHAKGRRFVFVIAVLWRILSGSNVDLVFEESASAEHGVAGFIIGGKASLRLVGTGSWVYI